MQPRQMLAIATAVLGGVVAAIATAAVLGKTARIVDLVAIFGGGFGAGAALVAALAPARLARHPAEPAPADGSENPRGAPPAH